MFPTRSNATDACDAGHVKIDGRSAKPATKVKVGDRVEANVFGRERVLEVAKLIEKRVGAPIAVTCYVDYSPPPPEREFVAPFLIRDKASGRPTKKDRRQIDRFRGH